MNTADNIRSRTTERQIEAAYLKLLEADYDHNVSVTMLCQEVGINRATFYAHFSDIYDLQAKLEERTASEIMLIFKDRGFGDAKMSYQRLVAILEYIKANRSLYLVLFKSGRVDNPKAMELVASRFGRDERGRYRVIFCKAGMSAVIKDWVYRECRDSVELVASAILEMYIL